MLGLHLWLVSGGSETECVLQVSALTNNALWLGADEAAVLDGEEDDEEEGLGLRQSSGMAHMGDGTEDTELGRGRKRRNLKNARPTGKARRRRLDEEDEQMEEVRIAKRRKRGVLLPLLFEVDRAVAKAIYP